MKYWIIVLACLQLRCTTTEKNAEKKNQEIDQIEYQQESKSVLNLWKDNICEVHPVEFTDLYTKSVEILEDKNEKLILADMLKDKGFKVVNWGRGNWLNGP